MLALPTKRIGRAGGGGERRSVASNLRISGSKRSG